MLAVAVGARVADEPVGPVLGLTVYGTPKGFAAVKFDVDHDGTVLCPAPRPYPWVSERWPWS